MGNKQKRREKLASFRKRCQRFRADDSKVGRICLDRVGTFPTPKSIPLNAGEYICKPKSIPLKAREYISKPKSIPLKMREYISNSKNIPLNAREYISNPKSFPLNLREKIVGCAKK
ncbi:MAG: hypothetical protein IK075_12060 [Prevotella sp.]|nr:hypothetical protein [Prevotella sp.]